MPEQDAEVKKAGGRAGAYRSRPSEPWRSRFKAGVQGNCQILHAVWVKVDVTDARLVSAEREGADEHVGALAATKREPNGESLETSES